MVKTDDFTRDVAFSIFWKACSKNSVTDTKLRRVLLLVLNSVDPLATEDDISELKVQEIGQLFLNKHSNRRRIESAILQMLEKHQ
jgi:hypothetical protein